MTLNGAMGRQLDFSGLSPSTPVLSGGGRNIDFERKPATGRQRRLSVKMHSKLVGITYVRDCGYVGVRHRVGPSSAEFITRLSGSGRFWPTSHFSVEFTSLTCLPNRTTAWNIRVSQLHGKFCCLRSQACAFAERRSSKLGIKYLCRQDVLAKKLLSAGQTDPRA